MESLLGGVSQPDPLQRSKLGENEASGAHVVVALGENCVTDTTVSRRTDPVLSESFLPTQKSATLSKSERGAFDPQPPSH